MNANTLATVISDVVIILGIVVTYLKTKNPPKPLSRG